MALNEKIIFHFPICGLIEKKTENGLSGRQWKKCFLRIIRYHKNTDILSASTLIRQLATICDYLGPFETIWYHLAPFEYYLGPFRTIWDHKTYYCSIPH